MSLRRKIRDFIDAAELSGAHKRDAVFSRSLLEHNEYGLAFDTLISQMYEHDIRIENSFYLLIAGIAESMDLHEDAYVYMKELIKD